METPEAAWVSMMVDRLQMLEVRVDAAERENAQLRCEMDKRTPALAEGFRADDDYVFCVPVDWRKSVEDLADLLTTQLPSFTICTRQYGVTYVGDEAPHPMVQLIGVVRFTEERTAAGVSQLLRKALGDAHLTEHCSRVYVAHSPDVCEAVIGAAEHAAHRDSDGGESGADLDLLLYSPEFGDFHSELRRFIACEHIIPELEEPACRECIEEIEAHLKMCDMEP